MIGKTLSHFRITAKLGEGGMGVVYRAEDERLHRPVALKVLPPELVGNEERRLRFLREARAAAAVSHPNIATIYDVGEADGQVFIAMELVEGRTLREAMGGRPLQVKDALRLATEMAEGMAAAHQAKVVHRDLKPDNVVVAASGHVKILDFGLAKLLQEPGGAGEEEVSRLLTISGKMTREGKILGTAAYMSPEQARGQALDARSDIFSFGTTLYEMVTGRVPFEGKTATDVLSAIVRDEPVPAALLNPEVPAELERIIAGCLEKTPEDRYQHTDQLAVDLRKLRRVTDSGDQVARAPGELASRPGRPRMARRARAMGLGLAVTLALLIGGWLFTRSPERTRDLRLKQLTANPTENPLQDAAISPDGKYLAFTDSDGVQLLLVETGEVHSIRLSEKFSFGELGWFPDSTRLITAVGAGPGAKGGLWVFPVIGGTPRRLRDDGWGGTVSPDGSFIAFLAGGWPAQEIWVMGPNGEQPRRIVPAEEGDAFFWVVWSPDGGRIAYGRMHSGSDRFFNAIESRRRGGGPASTIVSDSRLSMDWHGLLRPVWLPDGRLIFPLAESPPRRNDSNLWQIRADPRTGEPSGEPERITDWPDYSVRQLSATQDGGRIAILKVRQQPDIYLGELLEEGNRIGAVRQLTLDERADYPNSWTPDGRAVLFSSNRRGNWDIFKQRIEEAIPEPVVATPADESASEPSPDGRFALYWSSPDPDEAPATWPLMRVPLSGGAPERVLNAGETDTFACPRLPQKPCVLSGVKGAELAFSGFDPAGPKPVEVTRVAINPARFHDWALSPDGSRIAIVNFDDHVRIVSLEGGPVRDFKVEGWSLLESLSWSPGGNSLYIDGFRVRGKGILKLDLDGRVHPLLQRDNQWFMFPVPSPDGRYLAYSAMITQSNAWMVEGF